jgi:serine/threonine kinase PknH
METNTKRTEHLEESRPDMVGGPDDVDPDAETQYGYSRYQDYEDYPYSPESAPTAIVTTRSDSSSVIAMAILAAAVIISAVIVVVVVMTNTPDTTSTPAPTTIIETTVTAAPEPSSPTPTSLPTRTPTAAPPTVQDTAVPTPMEPVSYSLQRLRAQASLDTRTGLNAGNLWVPQLSSKRPGTVDDGIRWDHDDIWQEHLRLRQQYGAILLWSADWSFGADDLWVTVATTGFPTADGARQWCVNHGRDTWHCFPTQLR